MSTRADDLEAQLSALIGQHADWLDGPTWVELMDRVGHGYFDDMPEEPDAVQCIEALRLAVKNAPVPTF